MNYEYSIHRNPFEMLLMTISRPSHKRLLIASLIFSTVTVLLYFVLRPTYSPFLHTEIHLEYQKGQSCIHPKLDIWHPEMKKYFHDVPPLKCAKSTDWVYVENGTIRIPERTLLMHGNITCDYIPYLRGNDDFTVVEGKRMKDFGDKAQITSDFFRVECSSTKRHSYTNIHSGIAYNAKLHERSSTIPIPKESTGLNVMMFGFDSTSRMTMMRNLPKSHKYFVEELGAMVLEGYNIVGDGTPQALLPMLTGQTELELPDARRGIYGAKPVDDHPWIWKKFKDQGYVTQWGEDGAGVGTFTYRMLGFNNQPVDHYMRPFYLQAEKLYSANEPYCLGSIPRHLNMLNWVRDFNQMYVDKPKFSFLFHSEFTHGGYSEVRVVDDDLLNFLKYTEKSGYLNNTVFILMADHGARFQALRNTVQGKYEERMPYFGFRFPPWFIKKYPKLIKNFKKNTKRLTTPFDIHETFLHLLNFTDSSQGNNNSRAISLFNEVPLERTCADADIEPHWCACLGWKSLNTKDVNVTRSAQTLVDTINNITFAKKEYCERLSLGSITNAVHYSPNEKLLNFKQSADTRGFVPDLSDNMPNKEVFYQVTVTTVPGNAVFEATIKYSVTNDLFVLGTRDISRINKYGKQPHCVMNNYPHLRPYCYCIHQI